MIHLFYTDKHNIFRCDVPIEKREVISGAYPIVFDKTKEGDKLNNGQRRCMDNFTHREFNQGGKIEQTNNSLKQTERLSVNFDFSN